jgi:hypothetical protein
MMNDKTNLLNLGRTQVENQWHVLKTNSANVPPLYNSKGLIAENVLEWVVKNLGNIWQTPYTPYPSYTDPANNGIFKISKSSDITVTIALLADWASNTIECQKIAQQSGGNDYSIHLGDTYYVGNDQEIAENFDPDQGGTWPYGTLGSFAIPGNHEMYSGGKSYFTQLLPSMGVYQADIDDPVQVQQASFFCLENDYWRIIGLDTGYTSLKGITEDDNTDLDLRPEQQDWLKNTINLSGDNRGIIVLSHHQCFSAFENEFLNPASTISNLMASGRNIIWLCGHEHWFSVYGPNTLANGVNIFCRCIGNGGMPVELDIEGGVKKPNDPNNVHNSVNRNLVFYDQRQREVLSNGIRLGHNGYALLTLQGNTAIISYCDDNFLNGDGRKILEEKWSIDTATGVLSGVSITDLTINGDQPAELQLSLFGDKAEDAINV